jgi:pullulanase/glycogen debranching enzyme
MMSDALTAAGIITNALVINDIADAFTAVQRRNDYQSEVAHLRAWLDWAERRHQVMVGVCEKLVDAAKTEQAKDRRRIAELERQNADLTRQNDELAAGKKAAEDLKNDYASKLIHLRTYGIEREDVRLKPAKASA